MFGPDSAAGGLAGLPMILCPERIGEERLAGQWRGFFAGLGLRVLTMSPGEHDRQAARTQGLTHYLGRVLAGLELEESPIGTLGYRKLLEIIEQTCHDSWQLFLDLQRYNPYTRGMRERLSRSLAAIDRLLDRRHRRRCPLRGLRLSVPRTELRTAGGRRSLTGPGSCATMPAYGESRMRDVRIKPVEENDIDTILAEDINFEGVLTFQKPLMVKGRFKGEIKASSDLYVGEKAEVKAKIEADRVSAKGRIAATSWPARASSCTPRPSGRGPGLPGPRHGERLPLQRPLPMRRARPAAARARRRNEA